MTDRPKDENEKRKLRVIPRSGERDKVDPQNEITLEELLKEKGLSADDSEAEEVLVRRIDRKLAAREQSDYPWTRRIIGLVIILAAFFYGWKSLNNRSAEMRRRNAENAANVKPSLSPLGESPNSDGADISSKHEDARKVAVLPQVAPEEPLMAAPVDVATLNTISDCTKGTHAFRQLELGRKKAESGKATLESIFAPVLKTADERTRHLVQLQNVRIRTKTGAEWRLHASPRGEKGDLRLKLFKVAPDGLPEEIQFPPALKDLANAPLTDDALRRFLAFSESGSPLEIERHESWSYPDKAGAQIIWSDDQIFDIQVFMAEKFLACSRGVRAGEPVVNCKCVDHTR